MIQDLICFVIDGIDPAFIPVLNEVPEDPMPQFMGILRSSDYGNPFGHKKWIRHANSGLELISLTDKVLKLNEPLSKYEAHIKV